MAFRSLQDFVTHLSKHNQLVRISTPVSLDLEMTEIHRRVLEKGGPALLFEQPVRDGKTYDIPVLVNLFGSLDRVAMGIKRSPDELKELGQLLAMLQQPKPPENLKALASMMPLAKTLFAMHPKIVSKAPCQEVVYQGDDVDLGLLPIGSCWPGDVAPLISWPIVVTQGPEGTGPVNLGIYRMQVTGKRTTLMRWLRHRGGALHHQAWRKPMPAAVVIGADPATILAAVTPVPDTLSEYAFAGLLRNSKLPLVACKTIPLMVPAQAEIVLEGTVSLDERAWEGPYGDHTGYYNAAEQFPIFTISAITMRKKPLYLSTYTGRPPDEPAILGQALNALFVPMLQQQFPEIVDFWLPPEACSYRIAVVSLRKAYPGHAKRIMFGIWSYLRQFMYTKIVIIIDEGLDVTCWKDVMWAISTCVDPRRDMTMIDQTPIDSLDFASPIAGLGSKLGIDATSKWPGETDRPWGEKIVQDPAIEALVSRRWDDYGLDF